MSAAWPEGFPCDPGNLATGEFWGLDRNRIGCEHNAGPEQALEFNRVAAVRSAAFRVSALPLSGLFELLYAGDSFYCEPERDALVRVRQRFGFVCCWLSAAP